MLLIYETFSLKCSQLQQAIRMGDDGLVRALDRELEPLIAESIEYRAENLSEIHQQLQFVGDLVKGSAGDRASVVRHSATLSMLLHRYFGEGDHKFKDIRAPWWTMINTTASEDDVLNEAILDSLPDRIAVLTPDYRYLYANPAYAAQLRCCPIELVGRHIASVAGAGLFETVLRPALDRCFEGEAMDLIYDTGTSAQEHVRCRMSPLKTRSKSIIGAIVQFHDAALSPDGRRAA